MKGIFFDTETSGLPGYAGRGIFLQWAFMGWNDGTRTPVRLDTFRMLGDPNTPQAKGALAVNGYDYATREQHPIMQAGFVQAAYDAIREHDGFVIGCNPGFDLDMLDRTADRLGVARPDIRIRLIDVSSMAVPLLVAGKITGIGLRNMAALVGREQPNPHNAGTDVELTCDVFEKLFEHYYRALV